MLPGGSLRFVSLTDVFSTHYKACKEDGSQLRLFHAPARMKQSTVEGGLWSLEIIRAQESVAALADADAASSALQSVAGTQTLQSLLQGDPSMMVQIGKQKERDGEVGEGKNPSVPDLTEDPIGTGPVDVDDFEDEPIDEYDLLCNEAEDVVAQSDAALADCSKDEEKTVARATGVVC